MHLNTKILQIPEYVDRSAKHSAADNDLISTLQNI